MFHYVSSKLELFLVVYDYFSDLIKKEYLDLMNYDNKDIFDRLRQSYFLQMKLSEEYPWILEFDNLKRNTNSNELNKELEKRMLGQQLNCQSTIFDEIDKTKFRKELNIQKCKEFIYWSNIGFTNQILEDIRNDKMNALSSEKIMEKLDEYFDELRNVFYISNVE